MAQGNPNTEPPVDTHDTTWRLFLPARPTSAVDVTDHEDDVAVWRKNSRKRMARVLGSVVLVAIATAVTVRVVQRGGSIFQSDTPSAVASVPQPVPDSVPPPSTAAEAKNVFTGRGNFRIVGVAAGKFRVRCTECGDSDLNGHSLSVHTLVDGKTLRVRYEITGQDGRKYVGDLEFVPPAPGEVVDIGALVLK